MNSIWAILFVVVATFIGKWLLFDEDEPRYEVEDPIRPKLADPPDDLETRPLSKSA